MPHVTIRFSYKRTQGRLKFSRAEVVQSDLDDNEFKTAPIPDRGVIGDALARFYLFAVAKNYIRERRNAGR